MACCWWAGLESGEGLRLCAVQVDARVHHEANRVYWEIQRLERRALAKLGLTDCDFENFEF